jgi:hypothetical protein
MVRDNLKMHGQSQLLPCLVPLIFGMASSWGFYPQHTHTHTHTHTHKYICHFFHVYKNGAFLLVSMKILWNFVKTWI